MYFRLYKNTKMKSLFAGVFLFVFFTSCTKNYKPRKLDNVYIKEF